MSVEYSLDARPSAAQYIALLTDAGIAHWRCPRDAATYYPRIGYAPVEFMWELDPNTPLG